MSDHNSNTLQSVHTTNLSPLLQQLGISLMVTTYQAGKLVMLRADGDVVNTHFRAFNAPMGLALDGPRLAIGTSVDIWEYLNIPAVAAKLEPLGKHDVCYMPRGSVITGNVQIHELAWGSDDLWFVNTRFSCLCQRHPQYSFLPRWKPPFITAYAPEDRCHLNGLAMQDGQPKYVTALAVSDDPAGWRPHKRDGGVVMEVPSGEVLCRGLSMPHSPRFYAGRLWVLNSGSGSFGTVDPQAGQYQEVANLPGFTRGLDFFGRFAFIGLSQVRESAVFSGITIADRPVEERACGVWVVDIVSGQTLAFLKFVDGVQEIFAVQVLPSIRFPELINDDALRIGDSFILPEEQLNAAPAEYVRRS